MRSARRSAAACGPMLVVALAALVPSSVYLAAQGAPGRPTPRGAILIQATDTAINPIAAEIILPAFGFTLRLSEEGAVLLVNVPDGLYLLRARHLGYRPEWRFVRVAGDTGRVEFVLPPFDSRAGPRTAALVESRLRDFIRRSLVIPGGTFLTKKEIERRRPRNVLALLRAVSDITVDRPRSGPAVVRSLRAGQECVRGMLVFVDAVSPAPPDTAVAEPVPDGDSARPRWLRGRITQGAVATRGSEAQPRLGNAREFGADARGPSAAGERSGRITADFERVPVSSLAGLEIYPSLGGVPPEFRMAGAQCGVVLVWTTGR